MEGGYQVARTVYYRGGPLPPFITVISVRKHEYFIFQLEPKFSNK